MYFNKKSKFNLLIIFLVFLVFQNKSFSIDKNNSNLIFNIKIKNFNNKTDIKLQFKSHIHYKYFFLNNPKRLVIDFKNSNISINDFILLKKKIYIIKELN